ncbi:MAG: bifunctional diaminohydroxyphosphoribosylaminopyrimidine deaminase/5-amino-6-(5-phosphoribosylamino)uracil reductase RibD [Woeseiaceae bacterium]
MSDFTANEYAHMARALQLAERGCYGAHPNPKVGCVLVRDEAVVAEGWHERAGAAHAEVNALRRAGNKAAGATAFVTLEPCAHEGKTPPCSAALIEAGVSAVIVAMRDPYPAVAGKGLEALRDAGVAVREGLLQAQAETLNRGYLKRIRDGRPLVRLKVATSLDGCVAMKNGESQWITGPAARNDVQRLRARSGAILSGIGTVLADDPAFTVRNADLLEHGRQPLRVVVDSALRMPLSASMLDMPGSTLVACANDAGRARLEAAGVEVFHAADSSAHVHLTKLLHELARRGINDVLVEAGPVLAGSLAQQGLIDELVIYQAPHIMGSETTTMLNTPSWQTLLDRKDLDIRDRRQVGQDLRITAVFAS